MNKLHGKLVTWKTDKGYGFIKPNDGSQEVFIHVSDIINPNRRPVVGDKITFSIVTNQNGKIKAVEAILDKVPIKKVGIPKKTVSRRVLLNWIKAILVFMLFVWIIISILRDVEQIALVGVVAGIVSLLWIVQSCYRPKEKIFICNKCFSQATHNTRTIIAWKKGANHFYCDSCYHKWLNRNKGIKVHDQTSIFG